MPFQLWKKLFCCLKAYILLVYVYQNAMHLFVRQVSNFFISHMRKIPKPPFIYSHFYPLNTPTRKKFVNVGLSKQPNVAIKFPMERQH